MDSGLTNGFRITALNQDCDRLAVQSSVQSTWFCGFRGKLRGMFRPWSREVGIAQQELVVLRPYRGQPVIELEGLGGPHGVLVVDQANGGTAILRNGQRRRFELTAALVLKTEFWNAPRREGTQLSGV